MAVTDFNTLLSGSAAINRSGLLTALEKRIAYVVIAGEDPASLTPGNVNVIAYGGVLFNYDSADSTTAHDGITCIVTADGKRFKTDQFQGSNNALRNVIDKDLAAPPGSPALGDRYIVAASGTGAWATHDKQIAEYTARGWMFQVPNAYDVTMVVDEALYYHYSSGGAWTSGLPALTIANDSISRNKLNYFKLGPVAVENQTTNTPPGSPSNGVAYVPGGSPTGAGPAIASTLQSMSSGDWVYYDPYEGAEIYDKALDKYYRFNGATWDTPAAGLWSLIEEQAASASASLNFIGLAGYRALRITLINLRPSVTQKELRLRISSDNGATFISTGTYPSASSWVLTTVSGAGSVGGSTSDGGLSGEIIILDFNVAQRTKILSKIIWGDQTGSVATKTLETWQSAQTAMNAIQFLFDSANITSGSIILEGMT